MTYVTTSQVYSISGLTSSDVSEADVTIFIGYAEGIINSRCGYNYGSTSDVDEFKNVELRGANKSFLVNSGLPEYAYSYDQSVYRFDLNKLPVNTVNSVYVTTEDNDVQQAWSVVGSTYTDITSELNTEYAEPIALFPTGASGDVCYISCAYKFSKFRVFLSTVGVTGTISAEYYNGSSWTSLTLTDGTSALTANGEISFSLPSDFSLATVNNVEAYYIRLTVGTGYDTNPVVTSIVMDNDYVIYDTVPLKSIRFDSNGEVVLNNWFPQEGFRKLRFNYNYGTVAVPSLVEQLCGVIAGIIALGSLVGATYDELTSGGKGGESWTTGEQYMNLKNGIEQLRIQERALWKLVNKKIIMEVV